MAERHDRPSADGVPWAAALDPAANLEALSRIQQRGLRAAGEIVDRLVTGVDGARADTTADQVGAARPEDAGDRASQGAVAVDRLVDLWGELAKQFLHAMGRLASPADALPDVPGGEGAAGAVLDVEGGAGARPLRLTVPGPGVELWLVNRSHHAHHDLRLHATELRSHRDTVLPARVAFDPEAIESLPARSSRGVLVRVSDLDGEAAPGVHRGLVLVSGLPDAWVPIEVTARPAGSS